MSWEAYKKHMKEAGQVYLEEAQRAWEQYESESNAIFNNPKANPEQGRVTAARALARFWSRTEKVGMGLAGEEQKAFDAYIRPLRQQAPKPT